MGNLNKLYAWTLNNNFGDCLSRVVVEWITGKQVQLVDANAEGKLLAIGSVLHASRKNDIVWGSGVHPNHYSLSQISDFCSNRDSSPANNMLRMAREKFRKSIYFGKITGIRVSHNVASWSHFAAGVHICAVRGPITRSFLLDCSVTCPEIYGDPAILMPLVHPKIHDTTRSIGIIPHFSEMKDFRGDNCIDILAPWKHVIDKILECERIISTSLHGIIVAEAYGVPAIWLRHSGNEGILKFYDYYLGTGRIPSPARSLDEAVSRPVPSVPVLDPGPLVHAFPFRGEAAEAYLTGSK